MVNSNINNIVNNDTNNDTNNEKKRKVNDAIKKAVFDAYQVFQKLPDGEKNQYTKTSGLTGNARIFEQYKNYIRTKNPDLLDKIDSTDLKIEFDVLAKKGFKFGSLVQVHGSLIPQLETKIDEKSAIQRILVDFERNVCNQSGIPNLYTDFQRYASIPTSKMIDSNTKFKSIYSIYEVWENFLSDSGTTSIGDTTKNKAKGFLNSAVDKFDPTEKYLVTAMIKKIKKEIPDSVHGSFDSFFLMPINAFSNIATLSGFAGEWRKFLGIHKIILNDNLKSKLNDILITNQDVKNTMINDGIINKPTGSFSQRDQPLKNVLGNLVATEILEDTGESNEFENMTVNNIYDSFVNFPPFANELFKLFPYEQNSIDNSSTIIGSMKTTLNDLINKKNLSNNIKEKQKYDLLIDKQNKELNNERLRVYINNVKSQNADIGNVLEDLVGNNFNFSKLNKINQQRLIDMISKKYLDDTIKNNIPNVLGIDKDKWMTFIKDLLDLNKMSVRIPDNNGNNYIIEFEEKNFSGGLKNISDIEMLKDYKNLPLNFVIKDTQNSRAYFEQNEYWKNIFFDINAKNGKHRLCDSYKVQLKDNDGNVYVGYPSNYASGVKSDKSTYFYTEPLSYPGQNRKQVMSISGLPLEINLDNAKDYDIKIIDRKINLNGSAIGQMFLGYALGEGGLNTIKQMSGDEMQKLDNTLKKFDTYKDLEKHYPGYEDKKNVLASSNNSDDGFLKKHNSFKGVEGTKFEVGTRYLIMMDKSKLPPNTKPGSNWVEFLITGINPLTKKFKIKLQNCHQNWNKSKGNSDIYDDKIIELDMDESVFAQWEKGLGKHNIYKMPSIQSSGDSFEKQVDVIKKSGIKLSGINVFAKQIKLVNGKFVFSDPTDELDKGEIKYFGSRDYQYGKDNVVNTEVSYEVKHNSDNTFSVKLGDSSLPKRLNYQDFIIFIAERDLVPQVRKFVGTDADEKVVDGHKVTNKPTVYTIGDFIGLVTNGVKTIKDQFTKKEDARLLDLEGKMFGQGGFGLYGKLSFLPGMKKAQYEFDQKNGKRNREAIKYRYDIYAENGDIFGDFYPEVNSLLDGTKKPESRFQVAGALLALVKNFGAYGAAQKERIGKGKYVKLLFGESAWHRFRNFQRKKKEELKQIYNNEEWQARGHIDEFANMEISFIIDVIGGRKLADEHNPQRAGMRSKEFANELDTIWKEKLSPNKFTETYNGLGSMTFESAEFDYERFVKSGREWKALPFLKKMADSTTKTYHKKRLAMHIMILISSGVTVAKMTNEQRTVIMKICRVAGLPQGIIARDRRSQGKIISLLDMAIPEESNKLTNSKIHVKKDNGPKELLDEDDLAMTNLVRIDKYFDGFKDWWEKEGNGDNVMNFFDLQTGMLHDRINNPKPGDDVDLLKVVESKVTDERGHESVDDDLKLNYMLYLDSPLNVSNALVAKLQRIKNGNFDGDDAEKDAATNFWSSLTSAIQGYDVGGNKHKLVFMLKKFFNIFEGVFNGTKTEQFIRALKTAQVEGGDVSKEILDYMVTGEIVSSLGGLPTEMRSAVDAFKNFFLNNLDAIDYPILKDAVGESKANRYNARYKYYSLDKYVAKEMKTKSNDQDIAEFTDLSNTEKRITPIMYNIHRNLSRIGERIGGMSDQVNQVSDLVEGREIDISNRTGGRDNHVRLAA